MRIFLRLGRVELLPAGIGNDLRQYPEQRLIGKSDLGRQAFLVLGEGDEMREPRPVPPFEVVPGVVHDGVAQLTGPVRPEVEEDHAVVIADRRRR